MSVAATDLTLRAHEARVQLDAHVREIVEWHFNPESGCPFWLEFASKLGWDPRKEVQRYDDLDKFPPFQDEWLRGGPVRRWVTEGLRRPAGHDIRNRRYHRHSQESHQHRRLQGRLRAFQHHARRALFP